MRTVSKIGWILSIIVLLVFYSSYLNVDCLPSISLDGHVDKVVHQ